SRACPSISIWERAESCLPSVITINDHASDSPRRPVGKSCVCITPGTGPRGGDAPSAQPWGGAATLVPARDLNSPLRRRSGDDGERERSDAAAGGPPAPGDGQAGGGDRGEEGLGGHPRRVRPRGAGRSPPPARGGSRHDL